MHVILSKLPMKPLHHLKAVVILVKSFYQFITLSDVFIDLFILSMKVRYISSMIYSPWLRNFRFQFQFIL